MSKTPKTRIRVMSDGFGSLIYCPQFRYYHIWFSFSPSTYRSTSIGEHIGNALNYYPLRFTTYELAVAHIDGYLKIFKNDALIHVKYMDYS